MFRAFESRYATLRRQTKTRDRHSKTEYLVLEYADLELDFENENSSHNPIEIKRERDTESGFLKRDMLL